MRNSKKMLNKEVPMVFADSFPSGYKNDVQYWGNIPQEELHSCLPDGTAKLLTMDVDVGNVCGLNCPHCFRRDDRVDMVCNPLTHEEIVDYVKEAKELGLKQIKILGRGEPFQNPRFLEFLEEMTALGMGVAVFTKGHVLGSDELAERYNGHRGITTAKQLVDRLKELNVSILLGFNSFDHSIQEEYVGVNEYPKTALLRSYVQFRDRALINLVNAGFNEYVEGQATRLAFSFAPFKPENMDEVDELTLQLEPRAVDYLVVKQYSQHPQSINQGEPVKPLIAYRDWGNLKVIQREPPPPRTYDKCLAEAFWSYISSDGSVWGCSCYQGDERFLYGNIYERSFKDIWENRCFPDVDVSKCRIGCRGDQMNRYLHELTHPDGHRNFI